MAARISCDKPILKMLSGFEGASADDEGVGVEGVYHLVEEETQGVGLYPENFFAQRVALFCQATDQFGCLVDIYFRQFVAGISWQKIRQDIFFDGGERAEGLEVAGASAIALRIDAVGSRDALIRNQHVAEFSAESVFALHYIAFEDDAAAVAGADHAGDRSLAAVGAEDGVVSPEGSRVGIV